MHCNATAVLKIDYVYKQGKNYQVYVEECKYTDVEIQQGNILNNDHDGFFWYKKRFFVTCLGFTKLVINEQDVAVRTCKKVEHTLSKLYENKERAIKVTITKYKEIIFGLDTFACMTYLDELRKQQVIDKKLYDQKLMDDVVRNLAKEWLQKNMVMDGDMMIDRKTGEVLDPGVDSAYERCQF